MIHWSEAYKYESFLNQWESQLPTQLARVLANFARTYDLEAGFYQISIPKEFRHLFRFQDDAGELYEMCKFPMGASTQLRAVGVGVGVGPPVFDI